MHNDNGRPVVYTHRLKAKCYPAAYYQDGYLSKDDKQKQSFFEKALEINPNYQPALLELARCSFQNKNFRKCRSTLQPILTDEQSSYYRDAMYLLAGSYYEVKQYKKALQNYEKAWEYSDYNEYKYELAYWIANCYQHMNNSQEANQWYGKFLEENWEPERHDKWVSFAKNFLQNK